MTGIRRKLYDKLRQGGGAAWSEGGECSAVRRVPSRRKYEGSRSEQAKAMFNRSSVNRSANGYACRTFKKGIRDSRVSGKVVVEEGNGLCARNGPLPNDVRQGWVVILCDLSGLPPLAQTLSPDATDFVTAALSGEQRTQQRTA